MVNQSLEVDGIRFRRVFPWLRMHSAFRLALNPGTLVLAAAAMGAMLLGEYVIDLLPLEQAPQGSLTDNLASAHVEDLIVSDLSVEERQAAMEAARDVPSFLLVPAASIVRPLWQLLMHGENVEIWATEVTRWLWMLIVWSVSGGAICRIAALRIARDESLGAVPSLRFSSRRLPSYLAAPLLPLFGFALLWVFVAVVALCERIPFAGPVLFAVAIGVCLLAGLAMAVLGVTVIIGWPLMVAAISVENSDGFDGFSRATSYVVNRPAQLLWLVLLAAVLGTISTLIVAVMISAAVSLAGWSAAGSVAHPIESYFDIAQPVASSADEPALPPAATTISRMWLSLPRLLLQGYMIAYFWVATTIAYLLLRQADDGVLPEQIGEDRPAEASAKAEPFPVVGIAGSEREARSDETAGAEQTNIQDDAKRSEPPSE